MNQNQQEWKPAVDEKVMVEGIDKQVIESLQAENDALKKCNTEDESYYKAMITFSVRVAQAVGMEIDKSPAQIVEKVKSLQAENERLRESLQKWYETDCPDMQCGTDNWTCELCKQTLALLESKRSQP